MFYMPRMRQKMCQVRSLLSLMPERRAKMELEAISMSTSAVSCWLIGLRTLAAQAAQIAEYQIR